MIQTIEGPIAGMDCIECTHHVRQAIAGLPGVEEVQVFLSSKKVRTPLVFRIARRTMAVVRSNLLFTAMYNIVGLSLAATGLLPPVLTAAAQSLPDLSMMANSARLQHQDD